MGPFLLMSTEQIVETLEAPAPPTAPAVAAEPAAPPTTETAAPETPAKPDPSDLRGTIEHAMKNPGNRGKHATYQPRNEQGKFVGAPVQPPTAQPAVAPPPTPRPEMPKSLKLELKQHWEAAHPELAAAIHQRELDYEKGVMPLKEKARLADELTNEFRPYEPLLRAQGATPTTAIRSLLQTSAIFHTGSPVQKASAVAQLMRQFAISPEHVQQVLSGNAPPQPGLDPQSVASLVQQQVQQALSQQHQLEQDQLATSATERFLADANNKFADKVADDMLVLLSSQKFHDMTLGKSHAEKLREAYDRACWLNPEVRSQIQAEQQAKELTERQAKQTAQVTQARNAAVQVSGAPSSGPAPPVDPNDLREVVRANLNRVKR